MVMTHVEGGSLVAGAGRRPLLIVVSAPSGAGKTTLCDKLLREFNTIRYSVSCTTRAPRGQERDGVDYYFVTESDFRDRIQSGRLLEHATVHGNLYGTPREPVLASLAAGFSVLMDIDVQGAEQVRNLVGAAGREDVLRRAFVDIFIAPPSLAELRKRLEGRGEDSAATIERRMRNASGEMAESHKYRYTVVNDRLDDAFARLAEILDKEWTGHVK